MSNSLRPHVLQQASLSITNAQSLLRLMSIELAMPSNHFILCRPLLPSIFPSIRVFSNESVLCIRRSEYWSFSFSISPSNEYSGLISFRLDCFDLLAVLGTLQKHRFFVTQLSLWSKAEEKSQMAKCLMGLSCLGKRVTYQSWST